MKKLIIFILLMEIIIWIPSYLTKDRDVKQKTATSTIIKTTRTKVKVVEKTDQLYDLVITLRGTTYQPVVSQCNEDPLHTSNMTKVDLKKLKKGEQRLCAFSYDIKNNYGLRFGDKFDIYDKKGNFIGRYTFCDHMNRRIKNTCDIMIHPEQQPTLYNNMVVKRIKRGT